jgi:hypothetical protein
MMNAIWEQNLLLNRQAVEDSAGPGLVAIVSGTQADQRYWEGRFKLTHSEVFRRDGSTHIESIHEVVPRGNFLGTLCVWNEFTSPGGPLAGGTVNPGVLISMLFGKGTRLSPFTQALGNCKPRFPTPYRFKDLYLNIGESSTLYSSLLVRHLQERGFNGAVVKWGDEIMLPGADWSADTTDFSQVDAVRFAWFTQPTPDLAREKEWVLADTQDDRMLFQLVRQPQDALLARANSKQGGRDCRLGVNLGSLAASTPLLDLARQAFSADLKDPRKRVDWDPYVWLALACSTETEWLDEVAYEQAIGIHGMDQLQERIPDFYPRLAGVRDQLEKRNHRPFMVKVLDFGDVFWTDFGQHLALRQNLTPLLAEDERGRLTRSLFILPQACDERGNRLVNSRIPDEADIRDSLIVDAEIRSPETVIHGGIVIGGQYGRINMPQGGIAMFCTTGELTFDGPNAIAFQSILPELHLPEGGRHATVITSQGPLQLYTNEAIIDYKGASYLQPLPGNPVSFDEAATRVDSSPADALAQIEQHAKQSVQEAI